MSELYLSMFTYGPGESRCEIEVRPLVPDNVRGNPAAIQSWARSVLLSMDDDVKHTNVWGCSQCGKPARETNYDIAFWTHLTPPRAVAYIHHVCEAGTNLCNKSVILQNQTRHLSVGIIPPPPVDQHRTPGEVFPLASSCLGCKKDLTGRKDASMSRCGGCKLVRYCSVECQKADWRRHKVVCKTIKSVKWENWE